MNDVAHLKQPLKIEKPYLLLVEGRDEVGFFKALLTHMNVGEVQPVDVAGKTNLNVRFPAILPQMDRVKAYAIIQDADSSPKRTLESIKGVLSRNKEPCPKRIGEFAAKPAISRRAGIYLLPGGGRRGMLEDLCLWSVQEHAAMPCITAFIACLRNVAAKRSLGKTSTAATRPYPNNPAKARALAFLASMPFEAHRLGEAAEQGCWNFDHSCMAGLKDFISLLVSQ
jgi:hypothetical protein